MASVTCWITVTRLPSNLNYSGANYLVVFHQWPLGKFHCLFTLWMRREGGTGPLHSPLTECCCWVSWRSGGGRWMNSIPWNLLWAISHGPFSALQQLIVNYLWHPSSGPFALLHVVRAQNTPTEAGRHGTAIQEGCFVFLHKGSTHTHSGSLTCSIFPPLP